MALGDSAINPDEIGISDLEALAMQLDAALGGEVDVAPAPVPRQAPAVATRAVAKAPVASALPQQPKPTGQRARFAPLVEEPVVGAMPNNMDLLMDVSLKVTVELGRALLTVRDTLNIAPGHVVELDKVAGDPVDVLVNGRLIARGEVVVVDDQFGVRVTEIVSPRQRAETVR